VAACITFGLGVSFRGSALAAMAAGLAILVGTPFGGKHIAAFALIPPLCAIGVAWPVPCFIAVGVAYTTGWRIGDGPRRNLSPRSWLLLATFAATSIAVVAPDAVSQARSSPLLVDQARPSPLLMALLVGACALANSLGEELVWRGLMMDLLANRFAASRLSYMLPSAVQSVSFGIAHWHGLPSGNVGIAMASVFGAALAEIRRRYGILPAVACHALVDGALFTIVARFAQYGTNRYGFDG
jgi:membrane protease YdiL (CAAX protease family)